jgi:hypothetical protein
VLDSAEERGAVLSESGRFSSGSFTDVDGGQGLLGV